MAKHIPAKGNKSDLKSNHWQSNWTTDKFSSTILSFLHLLRYTETQEALRKNQ